MGLERLIKKTYGTVPTIDLDKKILQARIPKPETLDFPALADGMKRANVTPAAMTLEVSFHVEKGNVVLNETGQTLRLEGRASAAPRLRILGWESTDQLRAEIIP